MKTHRIFFHLWLIRFVTAASRGCFDNLGLSFWHATSLSNITLRTYARQIKWRHILKSLLSSRKDNLHARSVRGQLKWHYKPFSIFYPLNALSQAKLLRNGWRRVLPPLMDEKKNIFFAVNTKYISSHVLKISETSLVLRTREITDIFNAFDEIYLVSPQISKYPLYIFQSTYYGDTIFNYLYVHRHRAIYFIKLLYLYPRRILK